MELRKYKDSTSTEGFIKGRVKTYPKYGYDFAFKVGDKEYGYKKDGDEEILSIDLDANGEGENFFDSEVQEQLSKIFK